MTQANANVDRKVEMVEKASYQDSKDIMLIQLLNNLQKTITGIKFDEDTSLLKYGRLRKAANVKVCKGLDPMGNYVYIFDKIIFICKKQPAQSLTPECRVKKALKVSRVSVRTLTKQNVLVLLENDGQGKVEVSLVCNSGKALKSWISALSQASEAINPIENRNQVSIYYIISAIKHFKLEFYFQGHDIRLTTIESGATKCIHCSDIFWGKFFQGYRCSTCKGFFHKQCLSEFVCLNLLQGQNVHDSFENLSALEK